ncbi:MAG: HAD family phosphatase [Deltaproteobacteria bacterium]|nr:HAD family phosphatase [Deltaproteobacteria bacterium]MBW2085717.1 HAD family phosphatase [Deltaproteobacteria bacterium]
MIVSNNIPGPGRSGKSKPRGLFVTDLDGTLRCTDGGFTSDNLEALEELGAAGVVRAIATGRSLASFQREVQNQFPIDYVIFSSGAGVVKIEGWDLIRKTSHRPGDVKMITGLLMEAGHSFMIHKPVPDSHIFAYHFADVSDTDFEWRLSFSTDHSWPLQGRNEDFGPAAHLVAIVPGSEGVSIYNEIKEKLSGFTVIRTTSPLDHRSIWIEIFPQNVSKALTAEWLAQELGISRQDTLFVGNDYNDLDILEWAETSYVVSNSPPELKERFPEVASNNSSGVAEAIKSWLASHLQTKRILD